jgi:histidinol-phosphate aminotransferase
MRTDRGPGRLTTVTLAVPVPTKTTSASPYVAGRPIDDVARELGIDPASIVKLASNENPLGASPLALAAMANLDLARYPDGNAHALKKVIAAHHDVDPSCITVGTGSENLIHLVAQAFLEPGKNGVSSQYSFIVFQQAVHNVGATNVVVPAKDLGNDLDSMLAAIDDNTVAMYVANPNNPTGTFISPANMEAFLARVPARVLVVLDEAYNDYLPPEFRYDGTQYARRFPQVIVTRTFSKVYGLAGLRVGYSVSNPEVAEYLNRVRLTFNVNEVAQAAAAAALTDHEFIAQSYELNRVELDRVQRALDALGLTYVPSMANFVMINVGDAARINARLLQAGVIVRPMAMYGLTEWLRVSIGLPNENTRFLDALTAALL